ncbi:CAAX protease self-immunity [Anaerolinea thermolimosa]|uniref:CPBP family intramembrane glutamic endopeptidase n=1 Tax=Anaerolinea thermolimosa TaxID=229919 RepID=UPI000782C4F9|nr:CPBP family intramembrane glutamic endopeptidase [Anaerolinea thermolimosa]GAP07956.1 CAAX protease self-immunity [Anaerolinea thermolimosa]
MTLILGFFWNFDQHRLRAFWRLVLTLLLMAILVGMSQVATASLIDTLEGKGWLPGGGLSPQGYNTVMNLVLTAVTVLSIFLAGLSFDRRPFADFGFHFSSHWWIDFTFGLLLGAGLMLLIFGVELAAGWITVTEFLKAYQAPFWAEVGGMFLLFICVGVQEEIISRGYLLRNLAEGLNLKFLGPRGALLLAYFLSSLVFGALHFANPNASLTSTLFIAVAGLFLGLGFVLTGELAIPIGLHIGWNFFQGNVFGFPVSGTLAGPTFIAIRQGGPAWLTGAAFGPEAGVLGLAAILLGMALTVVWVRRRYGGVTLQTALAEYPRKDKETV